MTTLTAIILTLIGFLCGLAVPRAEPEVVVGRIRRKRRRRRSVLALMRPGRN
jgi:hypothetical protein